VWTKTQREAKFPGKKFGIRSYEKGEVKKAINLGMSMVEDLNKEMKYR